MLDCQGASGSQHTMMDILQEKMKWWNNRGLIVRVLPYTTVCMVAFSRMSQLRISWSDKSDTPLNAKDTSSAFRRTIFILPTQFIEDLQLQLVNSVWWHHLEVKGVAFQRLHGDIKRYRQQEGLQNTRRAWRKAQLMNVLVDFEVLKPCRGLSCSCSTSAWMSWASLRGRCVLQSLLLAICTFRFMREDAIQYLRDAIIRG
jgi:hypothetical protein